MKPVDIRNANYQEILEHLTGIREEVLNYLRIHGPCTTRELARISQIDILTVRPRVTELVELGFVECTGQHGREGIYRARSIQQIIDWLSDRRREIATGQMSLSL